MSFDWRGVPDDVLEQHYNPRAAIANIDELIAGLEPAAVAAREEYGGEFDLRYGEDEKQTFDVHRAAASGLGDPPPAFVFIHGGYWRALDKSDYSFVARAFIAAGATVINVNYDLCPSVSLDAIVRQARELIVHLHRNAADLGIDGERIYVVGHSAGAHLVAMLLGHDWGADGLPADVIKGAGCLTGIYEPGVVRRISVNDDVRLDAEAAERNDCILHPPRSPVPVVVAVGGDETEGWIAQSQAYAAACREAGCTVAEIVVDGTNHFTMLNACITPGTPPFEAMLAQIKAL